MNTAAKPYHHGNLRAALLERAAEVIDQQGIEALTLRGLARDLAVSHGAPNRHFKTKADLLSALATEGWSQLRNATLDAAEKTGSRNAHVRLNAMGRGYLRWALDHRALFRSLIHPDVNRQASAELKDAMQAFTQSVREAIEATQREGRHPDVPLEALNIFTNSVPTGAALLLIDSIAGVELDSELDQDTLIGQIIDLVVPLPGHRRDTS